MDNKIELFINQLINEGNAVQDISALFNKKINRLNKKNSLKKTTKKTKKKKICRPVFIISDSSCDEFN